MPKNEPARTCHRCSLCLHAVDHRTDDRCMALRETVVAALRYPSIEWMRSDAGACGPHADMFTPPNDGDTPNAARTMPWDALAHTTHDTVRIAA